MNTDRKELTCIKSTINRYGASFTAGRIYQGSYSEKGKRVKVEDDNNKYHYISWLRAEDERWTNEHFIGV